MSYNISTISLKKNNIEQAAYDVIDDICDEFDIELNHYPEVYWIGKEGIAFRKLFLKQTYDEEYTNAKINNASIYLRAQNIILINNSNPFYLAEECGHYIHFTASNNSYKNKTRKDNLAISILTEMLGYFSSKLFISERDDVKLYTAYPDMYRMSTREKIQFKKDNSIKRKYVSYPKFDFTEFYIYQQGYSLGDCLYNQYISGLITPKDIRKLFTEQYTEKNSATKRFVELKEATILENSYQSIK